MKHELIPQNQIKRLREVIQKRDSTVNEVQERERQLKVKVNNLSREVKREKEEVMYSCSQVCYTWFFSEN